MMKAEWEGHEVITEGQGCNTYRKGSVPSIESHPFQESAKHSP
jgi:hypothetical protein